MWTKQEIIPLSKKMREKVKQHGKIWWVEAKEGPTMEGFWHLKTLGMVHSGKYPYELWAKSGKDFRFGKDVEF